MVLVSQNEQFQPNFALNRHTNTRFKGGFLKKIFIYMRDNNYIFLRLHCPGGLPQKPSSQSQHFAPPKSRRH